MTCGVFFHVSVVGLSLIEVSERVIKSKEMLNEFNISKTLFTGIYQLPLVDNVIKKESSNVSLW